MCFLNKAPKKRQQEPSLFKLNSMWVEKKSIKTNKKSTNPQRSLRLLHYRLSKIWIIVNRKTRMLSVQVGQIYPTKCPSWIQKFRRIRWNCLWKYVNYCLPVFNLHINIWLQNLLYIYFCSPSSESYVSTRLAETTRAAPPKLAHLSLASPYPPS